MILGYFIEHSCNIFNRNSKLFLVPVFLSLKVSYRWGHLWINSVSSEAHLQTAKCSKPCDDPSISRKAHSVQGLSYLSISCSLFYNCRWPLCLCSCAQLLQMCPTLCDSMDCRLPGSSVHGIFQARILNPCPPPGDFPDPGIKPMSSASPALQVDSVLCWWGWPKLSLYWKEAHPGLHHHADFNCTYVYSPDTAFYTIIEDFKAQGTN